MFSVESAHGTLLISVKRTCAEWTRQESENELDVWTH